MASYNHISKAVFRVPYYPESVIHDSLRDELILGQTIASQEFLSLIRQVSPELYIETRRALDSDGSLSRKLKRTLLKYLSRACVRCTPFASLAGTGAAQIKESHTGIILSGELHAQMTFDTILQYELSQRIRSDKVRVIASDSIYKAGNRLRYLFQKDFSKPLFTVKEVVPTGILRYALKRARKLIPIHELAQAITGEYDVTYDEAKGYVKSLIEAQLLLSDAMPRAIDDNESARFAELATEEMPRIRDVYDGFKEFSRLDTRERLNCISGIAETIKELKAATDEKRFFKIDTYRTLKSGGVPTALIDEILSSLNILSRLCGFTPGNRLSTFISRFYDQYEEQEIPLLEALDPDIGIGYGVTSDKIQNPLIDGLNLPMRRSGNGATAYIDDRTRFLHKKLTESISNGYSQIEIQEKDVAKFNSCQEFLPDSISAMMKISRSSDSILLSGLHFTGPSAANLLGRFSSNPEIYSIIDEICEHEQKHSSHILAEISHISTAGIGNVVNRLHFRDLEINFHSVTGGKSIPVSDLSVKVKSGKVILRSKSLNKIVKPCLTNAHNYSFNTTPIYQFLCDIQHQNIVSGLSFSWRGLEDLYPRLPRVVSGNAVLSPASWRFALPLPINGKESEAVKSAQAWARENGIPNLALLTAGDNKLLIDFTSDASIDSFISELPKKVEIRIEEYIPCGDFIVDENGRGYANEFIIPLLKEEDKS